MLTVNQYLQENQLKANEGTVGRLIMNALDYAIELEEQIIEKPKAIQFTKAAILYAIYQVSASNPKAIWRH